MQSWRLREAVHRKTRRHDLVFRIYIVETVQTKYKSPCKLIRKSLKCLVSERSCSPILFYVSWSVLRLFSSQQRDISKTPLWDRTKRLERVDESERTCSESRRAKGYRYTSSKVLFEDPWIPSASTSLVSFIETLVVLETCFLPKGRVLFVCRFVRNNETTCNILVDRVTQNEDASRGCWPAMRR